jgi:spermidine/putrescine ABC transporter ATP-binding subunit
MFAVELENVSKTFGKVRAVDNISLKVEKGIFLTLLGPSGCGKTTTLRMLAGFEKPDSGTINIMGALATDKAPYERKTGMVFQNYALFPHMSVYDNIAFGLRMQHQKEKEIKVMVEECLRLIRLSGFGDRYPKQLSGGQQQRVALARALAFRPDVLLLDEPLSNLDLKLRLQMRFELKEIQRRVNVTAILVTHDQGEALGMSDQIAVMMNGRIQQLGTPIEVYEYPKNQAVADFIGEANFFEGKIIRIDKSEIIIDLDGLTISASPLLTKYYNKELSENNRVVLMIKPQKIKISNEKEGNNSFLGKIENIEYAGSEITYQISLSSDKSVKVKQQISDEFTDFKERTGADVYIHINPESCLILP